MLEQAKLMEEDHGAAVARQWLAGACSPDACARRRFEAHSEAWRLRTLLEVSGLRRSFPGVVDAELREWDMADLRALQTLEDELERQRARQQEEAWRRARQ